MFTTIPPTSLSFVFIALMVSMSTTSATSGNIGAISNNFLSLKKHTSPSPSPSPSPSVSPSSLSSSTSNEQTNSLSLSLQTLPAMPTSIFVWGHVTKYSTILCDEIVFIKGPIILDVKYPEIDNTNRYTIIGIQATPNAYADSPSDSVDLVVLPVKGGIGNNSTIVRFSLKSTRELSYTLVIHGVDV